MIDLKPKDKLELKFSKIDTVVNRRHILAIDEDKSTAEVLNKFNLKIRHIINEQGDKKAVLKPKEINSILTNPNLKVYGKDQKIRDSI